MPALLVTVGILLLVPSFSSAAPAAGWQVKAVPSPSTFRELQCGGPLETTGFRCNHYSVLATNIGSVPTEGPITLSDTVPPGLRINETVVEARDLASNEPLPCVVAERTITCEYGEPVQPDGSLRLMFVVEVEAGTPPGKLQPDQALVEGGEARAALSFAPAIVGDPPPFEVLDFGFSALNESAEPSLSAGGHPYAVRSSFDFSSRKIVGSQVVQSEIGYGAEPVEDPRSALVDLPPGLVGNPVGLPKCRAASVEFAPEECPAGSRVGTVVINTENTGFISTGESFESVSPIFNIAPERGYPAEFAFQFEAALVPIYATLLHTGGPGGGYTLRVGTPNIPSVYPYRVLGAELNFYGEPSKRDSGQNASPAFLRNPTSCSDASHSATIHSRSWGQPNRWVSAGQVVYSELDGCDGLQFRPSITVQPEVSSSDTPSGYSVELTVPKGGNVLGTRATPDLKDATVELPQGVAISPSAANSLDSCAATGPSGINIGSSNIGPAGEDLGDPEATELGAGHQGGNSSIYDDGIYHAAAGHCPASSSIGDVEVRTPLLEEPLRGHVYVSEPGCGGSKAPCTDTDASDGNLYGIYIEAAASGVIVKLRGRVAANPQTGALTATFSENPQLPFESFLLKFHGGPGAVLANPQTCGPYRTSSEFTPWSAPATPDATPSSTFDISSGAKGSACSFSEAQMPNRPTFEAGTSNPLAGQYSPFVLKVSREDGSQRLRSLNVSLPEGLLARLAGTEYCPESVIATASGRSGDAEKAAPSCPADSEVGTVTVGAGPGATPYYVQGHAYLAGPYRGAPLSLAIVTPATAGPFDLGTVVVRTALYVDPSSTTVTAKSDSFPTILDGTPLDIRSVALRLDRSRFTLNPTSCEEASVAAEAISPSGTAALLKSRFQVGGCRDLAFKPKLALHLSGRTTRGGTPAVKAVLTQSVRQDANIRNVSVVLPRSEFIDQAHVSNPCTRVQFAVDACPAKSILGIARAFSPLLAKPLEGPIYFRSNGGERQLPDLVADLHGQINVVLVGFIDSVRTKGSEVSLVRTRFLNVPDAPVSKFVLDLKGGSRGLLQNSTNLCKGSHRANASFTAHSGATTNFHPELKAKCPGRGRKK